MAYVPTVWENDITELDEDNMNHIEDGIKDNDDKLQGLKSMGSVVVDSIRSKNIIPVEKQFSITTSQSVYVNIPVGTYTISGKITGDSNYYSLIIFNKNGSELTSCALNHSGNLTQQTITLTDTADEIILYSNSAWSTSNGQTSTFNELQLEKGNIATSYSPYQELNIDYKKGTWTPVIQNATVNYTIQGGEYIKIGNLVYISFRLRGKITSIPQYPYAFITGIPFKPSNVPGCGSFYEYADCFNDNTTPRLMRISFDGTYPNGFVAIQNGGVGGMGISWWVSSNNTFYLSGSGFYIVN